MPKIICQRCEVEFKPEENGVIVAELFRNNKEIYKIWYADSWRCPICGNLIIAGFASNPYMSNAIESQENLRRFIDTSKELGRTVLYVKELTMEEERKYHERMCRKKRNSV